MRRFGRLLLAISIFRASLGLGVLLVFNPSWFASPIVCISAVALAQLSDLLDGWIARRYSTPSIAGYLEDSVADKLFHIGCLLALSQFYKWVGLLIWFICFREVTILAIRVVTPNLLVVLSSKKGLSVAYATLLRISIVTFFAAPLAPAQLPVGVAYGLLTCAALVGVLNIALLFTAREESGRRPS